MKTKRFLTSAVAMLVMFAIVGAGFSYWFFSASNTVTKDQTLMDTDALVTQVVAMGDVTPAGKFQIRFDQTAAKRNEIVTGGLNLGTNDATGITLVFESGSKYAEYKNGLDGEHVTRTFTTTMKLPNDLAEYVNVATEDTAWTCVKGTEGESTTTYTFTSTSSTKFDWEKVKLTYAEGQEPGNKTAYDAFKTIVDAANITVSYKVEVTSKAA